jgi:hypothetical protein
MADEALHGGSVVGSVRGDQTLSGQQTTVHGEASLTFVNQGARVRVDTNAAGALELVNRRLPVGSNIDPSHPPDASFALSVGAGRAGGNAVHSLYRDSALLESSNDLELVLQRLESELHFAVASHARSSLFVHAGVVGWQGKAILIPGRSMSGKTTLVAALLRAGAEYYSDEYAVIDAQGQVHPYPKPLGLRTPGNGPRRATRLQSVSRRVGTRPLPAGMIVSTSYSPGARFAPVVRGPSRGLMVLVANTVVIRQRPRFALDRLTPIADAAITLEGLRGDADQVAAWLLTGHHASGAGVSPDWQPPGAA